MDRQSEGENYSKEDTQRRVEAALRGARITGSRKMKDIPRKRPYKPRKRKAQGEARLKA